MPLLFETVRDCPFSAEQTDPTRLHVMFLAEAPSAEQAGRLDPKRSPPDRFELVGRQLYLHLPNGAARTKLTNDYVDRMLGTTSTGRNWRTVHKLLELADRGE